MWTIKTDYCALPLGTTVVSSVPRDTQPTILLVEDDHDLRQVVALLLRRIADAVIFDSANAETALGIARTIGRPADLVVSDIDLGPGMNGIEMAHEIRAISPATRVMLMSGDHSFRHGLPPDWGFIEKPFAVPDFVLEMKAVCEGLRIPPGALKWTLGRSTGAALSRK